MNTFPNPRQIGWTEVGQGLQAESSKQSPGCSAKHREQQAFDQKLADHPSSSRPERRSNGELACPRRRTSERQVGDVHATDQQDEPNGPEEHQQNRARVTNHDFLQGIDLCAGAFVVLIRLPHSLSDHPHLSVRLCEGGAGFHAAVDEIIV